LHPKWSWSMRKDLRSSVCGTWKMELWGNNIKFAKEHINFLFRIASEFIKYLWRLNFQTNDHATFSSFPQKDFHRYFIPVGSILFHATPLYPQKLALTSPTSGGHSVGIIRSRTKATDLVS
jgi:hypothetical protein